MLRIVALACGFALFACGPQATVGATAADAARFDTGDARRSGFVFPDAAPIDTAPCSLYPLTSRLGDAGQTWWWWYFHWDGVGDLPGFCASYGADAKMVLEVALPENPSPSTTLPDCASDEVFRGGTRTCAVRNSYRFEADCTAGELLFELPSQYAFTGYYHVESAQVPAAARRMVFKNADCMRDLYVTDSPQGGSADGGTVDATEGEAGQGCQSGESIPAGGSCSSIVTHCESAWTGDCWDHALSEVTNPFIQSCGLFSCGFLDIGFSAGCATVVRGFDMLRVLGDGEVACVESYLMSRRFDCVPTDGWVTLYVQCMLP